MAYSDEKMTFDEYENRYFLTENALLNTGIDIRARWNDATAGEDAVRQLLRDATTAVYNYAHDGVFDTQKQDYVINECKETRQGIYRALLAMAVSLARYGYRADSVDEGERAVAIPEAVKAEFDIVYPFLGHTLKYSGRW